MGRVTHADTQRMMTWLLANRENVAKYYVTVTAGQTHTIQSLGVSAATVVDWGDGLSNEYTGTATRTHVYAGAGTYCIKIYTPENVTTFDLRDGAAVSVLNSADLKTMVNVSTLSLITLTGAVGAFSSADLVDLRPSTLTLHTLPSLVISIDFAHWINWRPVYCTLYAIASAGIVISQSTIKNWSGLYSLDLRTKNLTQLQADLVLWECYQIVRTMVNGTIYMAIAGNASPSGTFQAATSCPVTASTPGKEIAHELLNDGCGKGFNKWATVSTN